MSLFKRFAYLMSTVGFSAFSFLAYSPLAHANSYPGGNWKLTFYTPVSHTDSSQEVYTVNPDGTDLQRITTDTVQEANPQWSPDMSNRKIAINMDTDETTGEDWGLFVKSITSSGAGTGSLTAFSGASVADVNEWDPSWSPDGTTIAFHRQTQGDTGPNHIHTIASTGTPTATALTSGDTNKDTEPTWNKEGTKLTFTRTNTADDSTSIAIISASGGTVTPVPGSTGGGSPQWSPVANTIVFEKSGVLWTYTEGDPSAAALPGGSSSAYAPTYSPDGKIIAATSSNTIKFYDSTSGALIHTTTIASNSGLGFDATKGIHEVDWARQVAPENTVHECTTTVNVPCTDENFTPNIPDECSTGLLSAITTNPQHGTPSFADGEFTFTPETDYVGTDQYIYTYYDQYMNPITCTVNITVVPSAPDSGESPKVSPILIGVSAAAVLATAVLIRKRIHR